MAHTVAVETAYANAGDFRIRVLRSTVTICDFRVAVSTRILHCECMFLSRGDAMVALAGSVVVVTGGANGIGRALAERFAAEGARAVVVADLDEAGAGSVAGSLASGHALALDVADPDAVRDAVERVETEIGAIDVWCSNAGIVSLEGLSDDADWDRNWRVNVLAHVYAARHALPRMVSRGAGHFLVTASAAGLLSEMDTAPYTVTKHGAVALTEWLAIRHASSGVRFSCVCPLGVRTAMTDGLPAGSATRAAAPMIEPSQVADAVVEGMAEGRFLILPHPEVAEYERRRATDRDRWLAGMARVWNGLREAV
jgi:NAD(P)-dependent dehydrogenase (short-subunit alcohol dehydrogenase family)